MIRLCDGGWGANGGMGGRAGWLPVRSRGNAPCSDSSAAQRTARGAFPRLRTGPTLRPVRRLRPRRAESMGALLWAGTCSDSSASRRTARGTFQRRPPGPTLRPVRRLRPRRAESMGALLWEGVCIPAPKQRPKPSGAMDKRRAQTAPLRGELRAALVHGAFRLRPFLGVGRNGYSDQ